MKKLLFITIKSILVAFSLMVVCSFSTLLLRAQTTGPDDQQATPEAQSAAQGGGMLDTLERIRESQSQQLEGSWTIILTPILPPGVPPIGPFTAYTTFSRGGAFIGSARENGFSASTNPQHGVWEHRGGNRFAFSFKQDGFDVTGKFINVLTTDTLITVTGKDSFVGVTNGELHDAEGHLILTLACGTVRGERMKIGTLADQCQHLTPLQ